MWYGVYDRRDRALVYTNAGHPPALVFERGEVLRLGATGTMVGLTPEDEFQAERVFVPRQSRLYLYSDGAYEVTTPQGGMLMLEGLEAIIARLSVADGPQTAEILRLIRQKHGKTELQDDVSLLEVAFD
jgi:sigma-B regulation protein RsbU (phosphoserine phosphatase)